MENARHPELQALEAIQKAAGDVTRTLYGPGRALAPVGQGAKSHGSAAATNAAGGFAATSTGEMLVRFVTLWSSRALQGRVGQSLDSRVTLRKYKN